MYRNIQSSCAGLVSLSAILMATACGPQHPGLPQPGAFAPVFTLDNQDGKPISLKDYRGKWVVLYFYHQDFGRQVTGDLRSFKADLDKLQALNTVVLCISGNTVASHKSFAEQEQLPFTLLSDVGLTVATQYGSITRKFLVHELMVDSTFIVNPQGKIARVLYDFGPADPGGEILSAVRDSQHS
jgi:peroxiredoxin Q/BCP